MKYVAFVLTSVLVTASLIQKVEAQSSSVQELPPVEMQSEKVQTQKQKKRSSQKAPSSPPFSDPIEVGAIVEAGGGTVDGLLADFAIGQCYRLSQNLGGGSASCGIDTPAAAGAGFAAEMLAPIAGDLVHERRTMQAGMRRRDLLLCAPWRAPATCAKPITVSTSG